LDFSHRRHSIRQQTVRWYTKYQKPNPSPPLTTSFTPAPFNDSPVNPSGHRCVTSRVQALSCTKWTQLHPTLLHVFLNQAALSRPAKQSDRYVDTPRNRNIISRPRGRNRLGRPLRITSTYLLPPRWNTVEIDCASLGQSEFVELPHQRVSQITLLSRVRLIQ